MKVQHCLRSNQRRAAQAGWIRCEPGAQILWGESPATTSRAAPRENPKRYLPLTPDIASFETEKGHWTEEVCEGPSGIR